ncbi:MAG: hypothetical protein R3178_11070 [Rhodothermales bacterium]|nr:hypothetical protein [Rhodothermales bacterium]
MAGILLTGCETPDTSAQATGGTYDRETEVFEEIGGLDFGAVVRAYETLAAAPYRVQIRSAQKDEAGQEIASETISLRVGAGGAEVVPIASDGEMSSGFMAFVVANDSVPDLGTDVAGLWTPEEPSFASARNRDYYRYSLSADTVVSGEACRSYAVEALDGVAADRMPIRNAQVYTSTADSTILAIRIRRQDDALFYRERSSLAMTLRRSSEGSLLPVRRSVEVVVEAPLRSTHYFETTQEYEPEGMRAPTGR